MTKEENKEKKDTPKEEEANRPKEQDAAAAPKVSKQQQPKTKRKSKGVSIVHRRASYLYQAAHVLSSSLPVHLQGISRYYCQTLKKLATKTVTRLSPAVKSRICKRCSSLLLPGVSCTIRTHSRRQRHLSIRCTKCGFVKRYNNTICSNADSQRRSLFRTPPTDQSSSK